MRSLLVAVLLTIGLQFIPAPETGASSFTAETTVYFSPNRGATAVIVRELGSAQHSIMVQAYSFTSAPIAKALLDAHKRGVKILAVLDKSNQTDKYSAATFLANASIPVLIDAEHAIALASGVGRGDRRDGNDRRRGSAGNGLGKAWRGP